MMDGVKLKRPEIVFSSSSITAGVVLAEPFVLLRGFKRTEQAEAPPTILRGSLVLQVHKPTKIKSINLEFHGTSRTEWPEGIPPLKVDTHETSSLFYHNWPFFTHTASDLTPMIHIDGSSGSGSGSPSVHSADKGGRGRSRTLEVKDIFQAVSTMRSASPQIRSRSRGASFSDKQYRLFSPAEYVYNFELALPSVLPETCRCNFGFIRYFLEASIERQGTFKSKLSGSRDVAIVRGLGLNSLEFSEPIVIDRSWEDLLKYEIVVAGKVFPIGGKIPVSISLIPLDKAGCHRIRVFITEHCEYYCRNRKVHRIEPTRRFLLLDKQPKEGLAGSLLNEGITNELGAINLDLSAEILKSFPNRRDVLRPNISCNSVKVHHWIKISLRLSRPHPTTPNARKTYEISIDSPVMLVDQRVTKAAILPEYMPEADAGAAAEATIAFQAHNLLSETGGATFFEQPTLAPPPIDAEQAPPHEFPPEYGNESYQSYTNRYKEFRDHGHDIEGDHISSIYWEEDEDTPQLNVTHVSDEEDEYSTAGFSTPSEAFPPTTSNQRHQHHDEVAHDNHSTATERSTDSLDDGVATPATSTHEPELVPADTVPASAQETIVPAVSIKRVEELPELVRSDSGIDPLDLPPLAATNNVPEATRPYTAPSFSHNSNRIVRSGSRHSSIDRPILDSRSSSVSSVRFFRQTSLVSVDLIDQSIARYRSRGNGPLSETPSRQPLDPDQISVTVDELGSGDRIPLLDDQSEYDLAEFDDGASLRSRQASFFAHPSIT